MRAPWEMHAYRSILEIARFDPSTAMILAGGMSALSSVAGGIQQQRAYSYNADLARAQAAQVTQESQAEAQQQEQQTKRTIGEQIAAAGASGVDATQGSPVNVVADQAQQGELSRQLLLYRGQVQSTALNNQAAADNFYGNQALVAGFGRGGSTLLTAGAQSYYSGGANPRERGAGLQVPRVTS